MQNTYSPKPIDNHLTKRHRMSEDRILVSPKGFQVLSPTAGKCIGNLLFCFVLTSLFQFISHDTAPILQ